MWNRRGLYVRFLDLLDQLVILGKAFGWKMAGWGKTFFSLYYSDMRYSSSSSALPGFLNSFWKTFFRVCVM